MRREQENFGLFPTFALAFSFISPSPFPAFGHPTAEPAEPAVASSSSSSSSIRILPDSMLKPAASLVMSRVCTALVALCVRLYQGSPEAFLTGRFPADTQTEQQLCRLHATQQASSSTFTWPSVATTSRQCSYQRIGPRGASVIPPSHDIG